MRLPFVSRARFDNEREVRRVQMIELREAQAELAAVRRSEESLAISCREWNTLYASLLEKYHALRVEGANVPEPAPPVVTSPLNDLGPQTLAALDAMGKGQTGLVRRAMQSRAIQLWHEMQDKPDRDSLVAKAVWHGEAVMAS